MHFGIDFGSLPDRKAGPQAFSTWISALAAVLPLPLQAPPANWHQFDAAVCWLSGYRFLRGAHETYGNKEEGVIVI